MLENCDFKKNIDYKLSLRGIEKINHNGTFTELEIKHTRILSQEEIDNLLTEIEKKD